MLFEIEILQDVEHLDQSHTARTRRWHSDDFIIVEAAFDRRAQLGLILGEVFLQMVRDIGRFEGGEPQFRAWAFTIAHHRLMDDRRYRARRPAQPAPPEEFLEAPAPGEGPEVRGIVDRGIERALRRLPRSSLEHQHAPPRIGRQAVGQHAAGGACPDDDDVE